MENTTFMTVTFVIDFAGVRFLF